MKKITLITVDAYAHGIAWGQHLISSDDATTEILQAPLSMEAIPEMLPGRGLRSRYLVERHSHLHELEAMLRGLKQRGKLYESVLVLGSATDPLYPFDGKFDATAKFLEILGQYTPGTVLIRTRSPLIVLAMPALQAMGDALSVVVPIETHRQETLEGLGVDLPRLDDRCAAVRALRSCGVRVIVSAAPLLSYGKWQEDAAAFAQYLTEIAEFLHVAPVWDGSAERERQVKGSILGKKLQAQRAFHWLRADAAAPLLRELQRICPGKLVLPKSKQHPEQIALKFG